MSNEHHPSAYERMIQRAKEFLTGAEKEYTPKLQQALDEAKEKTAELGELSREEAEKVSDYLKRDLQDAGQYLASDEAQELRDWLRFDTQLLEERALDALSLLVDQAKVDFQAFNEQAQNLPWKTGEVTGPGTLVCSECGEELHFKKAGHIPPCPKCAGTTYQRRQD
jgi:excinuclease UvrABC nuclease subunit